MNWPFKIFVFSLTMSYLYLLKQWYSVIDFEKYGFLAELLTMLFVTFVHIILFFVGYLLMVA